MGVEGAGGVDQQSAGQQAGPNVGKDGPLQRGTLLHVGRAPLADALGVLAKHALAGARHVGEDEAEAEAGALVVDGVVVGHDDFGVAKLHDVLGQDLRPLRMGLVAVETAPLGQGGTQTRRLAARGRTEVEGRDGGVDKLADDVVDEH